MTTVVVPTHLRSYTGGSPTIEAQGATLGALLADVEAGHPGFLVRIVDEQDRIRPHVKLFVAGEQARDLAVPVTGEVHILAALSGG